MSISSINIAAGPWEVEISFQWLLDALDDLADRIAIRRLAPEDEPEEPRLRVRVACPDCRAGLSFLSRRRDGDRQCRKCGSIFGLEV